MKIKALLVDDDPLAIERLRQLLRDESDVQIVGECGDELAASSAVRELQPDLVFLDVRLPGVDGFGVMNSSAGRVPIFIVVTAHAQHAPRAFETHAVDFLLKPFTRERFRKALDKARERLRHCALSNLGERLAVLRARAQAPTASVPPLGLKGSGRVLLIPPATIACIVAAGDDADVYVEGECHRVRQSLGRLQSRLPAGQFLRINRSTVVNVECIKELELGTHGDSTLVLSTGQRLPVTRRYRTEIDRLLEGLV